MPHVYKVLYALAHLCWAYYFIWFIVNIRMDFSFTDLLGWPSGLWISAISTAHSIKVYGFETRGVWWVVRNIMDVHKVWFWCLVMITKHLYRFEEDICTADRSSHYPITMRRWGASIGPAVFDRGWIMVKFPSSSSGVASWNHYVEPPKQYLPTKHSNVYTAMVAVFRWIMEKT